MHQFTCPGCHSPISAERAQAIVDFDLPVSCIPCSKVEIPIVFMSYDHKTAGQAFVVPSNADGSRNEELVRKATRCHQRAR